MFFRILALLIFLPTVSFAVSRNIHVEWSPYTAPSNLTVAGFDLYKNGVKVCSFNGASITNGDCTIDMNTLSDTFTLTARFTDGTESPKSIPYVFTIPFPAPEILSIKII
jgi:hypothetical protein